MNSSSTDSFTIFNAMPGSSALVLPDAPIFTVVGSTVEFAEFAGAAQHEVIGSSLFRYFPDNPKAQNVSNAVRASLESCLQTKDKNELAVQRYDIGNPDGSFRTMYWTVIHTPVLDKKGEVSYLIHTAVDVTERILAGVKDEKIRTLSPAHNLFLQSSLAIHILKGPDFVVALANEPTLRLWGRGASAIGKPLADVVPELFTQDFGKRLQQVTQTRIPTQIFECPLTFQRDATTETLYVNYVIQPYNDDDTADGKGVIVMINDVTANYRGKIALAEKERSLQLAIEIGELGVFSIDLSSKTVNYSQKIMEWFGVTDLNRPLSELLEKIHRDDAQLIEDTLHGLSNGKPTRRHDLTFRVTDASGEVRYLRSIAQLQGEEAKNLSLSGILQDITSNVQSQVALEQVAHRLRTLIDNAPFPIGVYIGPEMRIEMVNQSILDAWGRGPEVVGRTYAEALPELEGQGPYEQLKKVFESGKAFNATNRQVVLVKDGIKQTYYFNYSFTPLFDNCGNVYGVMNTAADVTELVVAQKALKESERNFRTMILQAPIAMCLLQGPNYMVEIANEPMLRIWGKMEEEVMAQPIFEVLPEAREQGLQDYVDRVYYHGETVSFNEKQLELVRFGLPDTVYLNFVYEPYRDGNGSIVGVLAIATNVTEQVNARHRIEDIVKERTHELEQANDSLQKSNAELEQFAYIASHDLQEPLRKINMFTGMLKSSLSDIDERSYKHMENIMISVRRMSNLISDILRYSQLSRVQEPFQEVDLNDVYIEAIADFDLTIEQKDAEVLCGDLPAIEAVPLQMVQLFHNLISNAIKYSREGVRPRLEIRAYNVTEDEKRTRGLNPSSRYIALSFADNGIGFSEQYASKIFNIFQRLHGRGQYEGTGIGLAMCKKIAENHHGVIFASSFEGKGSEFVIILPKQH